VRGKPALAVRCPGLSSGLPLVLAAAQVSVAQAVAGKTLERTYTFDRVRARAGRLSRANG